VLCCSSLDAKAYLVVDACIHTDPYKRTKKDFDYKLYIMELAMEWVEEKCRVELSRSKQRFTSQSYLLIISAKSDG